jgi:enamine deaminase RidA (YjgF/YER057c/UK114 family)
MQRTSVSTGTMWEDIVGYARAVRVGPFLHVTGTIAVDERGEIIGAGDAYAQTAAAIEKVRDAIVRLGGELNDVVRTRLYVTDIDRWRDVGRAHAEAFGAIRPCTTMVEVSRLALPEALVEVEAEAIIATESAPDAG